MARWTPSNTVGPKEQIGRRLFDEPMLMGAVGQPSFSGILITHFEETRGNDVSLDRLGASGFDRKVASYLLPRAEAAGKEYSKPKSFNGWAIVTAKELTTMRKQIKLEVVASPVNGPEPDDNFYHAHVVRPQTLTSHLMALHLRFIFTTFGTIERIQSAEQDWKTRVWQRIVSGWPLARFFR